MSLMMGRYITNTDNRANPRRQPLCKRGPAIEEPTRTALHFYCLSRHPDGSAAETGRKYKVEEARVSTVMLSVGGRCGIYRFWLAYFSQVPSCIDADLYICEIGALVYQWSQQNYLSSITNHEAFLMRSIPKAQESHLPADREILFLSTMQQPGASNI